MRSQISNIKSLHSLRLCGCIAVIAAGGFIVANAAPPATTRPASTAPAHERRIGRYTYREQHDPNGIGKFYMGREIAHVMGHEAADWLERPEREQEEATSKLIPALKLRAGDVAADIGAGSGYYTTRLAKAVGPTGRVKAVDIQPEMLDLLKKKLADQKLTNVDLILGKEDDPKLPPDSIDLALLVDVYHEFEYPFEMTQHLSRALKPGGRIVLVEFRLEDAKVPIKRVHKMSEAQAIREMYAAGLHHKETIGILPWQHILVFQKRSTTSRPATGGAD